MKIAFSGHRSDKIIDRDLLIEKLVTLLLNYRQEQKDLFFITGGSTGFDTIVLAELIKLFSKDQIEIMIPFSGFETYATKDWSEIKQAQGLNQTYVDRVKIVGGEKGSFASKCYKRNESMIKEADLLICYWNGSPSGTGNTVKLALKKGIDVINLFES